jgi:glycosyltransferase involved in cell wall biosynthesis
VIPNGIDTELFAPDPVAGARIRDEWGISPKSFVVGHVGRLDPIKDHELLLAAFSRFAAMQSDARLVCVGAGSVPRRDTLLGVASHAGIRDRVHFVGARNDLRAVYSAFDVLALTSRLEGFPNVVAEAMACGIPAVVTPAGASADIVGALGEVSTSHDAGVFAAALSRLAARRTPQLSAACRARVLDHFSLARCAQHTLDLLQSLNSRRIS